MLGLYLLGQNCLHLTCEQYLSSKTYSFKYEKLPNILILACKNITEKMHLLKLSGPQIWLCLFTFRPIAFGCKRSRVKFPAPARVFMFDFLLCCCCVFTFCPKTHYSSQNFAISFAMLIFLVYLTYRKICDRL